MSDTEPIRPLKDVWLRPRRVFRELATHPIGATDYILAAAQLLGSALMFGPLGGVVSMYLFAAIYGRLGKRVAGQSARNQVFHVLAYGGIPVAASLILWTFTALLVGDAAILNTPGVEVDGFVAFVLRVQFTAYMLLALWSIVLQVMGFSETLGLTVRRAFAVWVLGQVLGLLAYLFLIILIGILFPGIAPPTPH